MKKIIISQIRNVYIKYGNRLKANIPTILSLLAICLSIFSMYYSNKVHSDSTSSSMIRENYNDFLDLHLIRSEHPLQSHIFVSVAEYENFKFKIFDATKKITLEKRIENQLIEAGLARRIFSMYEHSYFQWKNSKEFSEKSRINFLKLVLDYFTNTLLKNPRLAWYWSSKGGNNCVHYEVEVLKYYNDHVVDIKMDSLGPYN